MKKIFTVFLLSLTTLSLKAQLPGGLCNWYADKKAAVVLTFDDWSPGHYPIVVPELKNRNLNATFFVELNDIAAWNHPWSDVVTTASYGNEIGNHTKTHPDLTTKTAAQLNDEIHNMKILIDQNVSSQIACTFAYPFGNYNTAVIDTIKASGHIAARTVSPGSSSYNFAPTNDDYYKIGTYAMSGTVSTSTFSSQVQTVINGGGLLTFLYHSVDNSSGTYGDNWYAQVLQDSLKKQLDKLVSLHDKIWVTPFSNAIKYHQEKRCATLTEVLPPDGTTWTLNLTDTLSNNALYNQPLTIKLKMNGVSYHSVTQNGIATSIDAIRNDSIIFNAVPDGGQIVISTSGTYTAVEQASLTADHVEISPVPTNGILNIKISSSFQNATLSIRDAVGKEVYTSSINNLSGMSIDMSFYTKGLYYICIQQPAGSIQKKIIVTD